MTLPVSCSVDFCLNSDFVEVNTNRLDAPIVAQIKQQIEHGQVSVRLVDCCRFPLEQQTMKTNCNENKQQQRRKKRRLCEQKQQLLRLFGTQCDDIEVLPIKRKRCNDFYRINNLLYAFEDIYDDIINDNDQLFQLPKFEYQQEYAAYTMELCNLINFDESIKIIGKPKILCAMLMTNKTYKLEKETIIDLTDECKCEDNNSNNSGSDNDNQRLSGRTSTIDLANNNNNNSKSNHDNSFILLIYKYLKKYLKLIYKFEECLQTCTEVVNDKFENAKDLFNVLDNLANILSDELIRKMMIVIVMERLQMITIHEISLKLRELFERDHLVFEKYKILRCLYKLLKPQRHHFVHINVLQKMFNEIELFVVQSKRESIHQQQLQLQQRQQVKQQEQLQQQQQQKVEQVEKEPQFNLRQEQQQQSQQLQQQRQLREQQQEQQQQQKVEQLEKRLQFNLEQKQRLQQQQRQKQQHQQQLHQQRPLKEQQQKNVVEKQSTTLEESSKTTQSLRDFRINLVPLRRLSLPKQQQQQRPLQPKPPQSPPILFTAIQLIILKNQIILYHQLCMTTKKQIDYFRRQQIIRHMQQQIQQQQQQQQRPQSSSTHQSVNNLNNIIRTVDSAYSNQQNTNQRLGGGGGIVTRSMSKNLVLRSQNNSTVLPQFSTTTITTTPITSPVLSQPISKMGTRSESCRINNDALENVRKTTTSMTTTTVPVRTVKTNLTFKVPVASSSTTESTNQLFKPYQSINRSVPISRTAQFPVSSSSTTVSSSSRAEVMSTPSSLPVLSPRQASMVPSPMLSTRAALSTILSSSETIKPSSIPTSASSLETPQKFALQVPSSLSITQSPSVASTPLSLSALSSSPRQVAMEPPPGKTSSPLPTILSSSETIKPSIAAPVSSLKLQVPSSSSTTQSPSIASTALGLSALSSSPRQVAMEPPPPGKTPSLPVIPTSSLLSTILSSPETKKASIEAPASSLETPQSSVIQVPSSLSITLSSSSSSSAAKVATTFPNLPVLSSPRQVPMEPPPDKTILSSSETIKPPITAPVSLSIETPQSSVIQVSSSLSTTRSPSVASTFPNLSVLSSPREVSMEPPPPPPPPPPPGKMPSLPVIPTSSPLPTILSSAETIKPSITAPVSLSLEAPSSSSEKVATTPPNLPVLSSPRQVAMEPLTEKPLTLRKSSSPAVPTPPPLPTILSSSETIKPSITALDTPKSSVIQVPPSLSIIPSSQAPTITTPAPSVIQVASSEANTNTPPRLSSPASNQNPPTNNQMEDFEESAKLLQSFGVKKEDLEELYPNGINDETVSIIDEKYDIIIIDDIDDSVEMKVKTGSVSPSDSGLGSPFDIEMADLINNNNQEIEQIEPINYKIFDNQPTEQMMCLCGKKVQFICSCRTSVYCSEACRMIDWDEHQRVCSQIVEL